jgi:superfamily II RNA helicase
VEILFRKGYLRVVIATGTLALGINMPCSTVIFSGDSVFLTALNFRQAAGRAGRRGFDLLGNVIFQDVSTDKINRLLSSKLPALNGHFPLTTSLVLRLFSLLHNSDNSPFAVQAINSLLSQPRIYLSGPSFQAQVLHHLRFSIEYLRRQSLLDMTGAPLNFAGAVSHLYYTENSSFAFHALLKGGFLHQMCENIIDKPEEVSRSLMFVMSHLFGRRLCRRTDVEFKEKVVKKSPSMVYLPPLPREAVSILRQHNTETRQIFTTYVKTFIDQHLSASEQSLPLTNFTVGGQDEITGILPCLPPARIRSSFVALSGHGDEFQSISDLCSTVRSGVFLEKAVIPYMELYPDDTGISLNAYLLDFYLHGDTTALAEANGVRKAEVWFLLNG